MMVVVANTVLISSRRSGGLDAPDEPLVHQEAEGLVDRLQRDRANFGSDDFRHRVRRDVGLPADRPQHRQSLSRNLNTALSKEVGRVGRHSLNDIK